MANNQKINEIIDDAAFNQLDLLETKLVASKRSFVEAAKAAKDYNSAVGGAKSLKEFSNLVDVAVKANTKLGDSSDKIRLAEIRLETARRKAFDDFEKRLARQQTAQDKQAAKAARDADRAIQDQQRQQQADVSLRNARIANIEAYNARLAQQGAAQERATLAQIRAAEAARAANMPYNRLNTELGVLRTRARDIGIEFGVNSRQFRDAAASVQVLDGRIRSVDTALGQSQRNVGNYTSALAGIRGQFVSMAAQYLSFYAVVAGIRNLIKNNAQISDSLADVQRTAGLTAKEANNLAEQLKKIDTRTSLKGLLAISTIGGQLGIAKDQLAGFTQVVDQLSVVLSNEIPGGAEAVATSLGKINGVFKVQQREGTNTEDSLRKTGSAILALGQAGLATGAYLQDFTLRTAGTAQVAKISLPTILAYSAVLEETGSSAEVAGTAFNKLVGSLASKREQFFAIAKLGDAKLTLKEFTDLINKDADAALQKFFVGLNRGGSSLTTFTDLLDTLKIKSGPGKNAIIALAENQALLATRVEQSNKAYSDGSLIADQFAIKNDNLAASIDKLGNAITNITTNPNSNLGDYFKRFINTITGGIKAIDIAIGKLKELQYNMAIENYNKKGSTGNIFIGVDDVKSEITKRDQDRQAARRLELQKIGVKMAKDIILDNKYTGKSVQSLIEQEAKLGNLRAEYTAENSKGNSRNLSEVSRILTALEKQKALVSELKRVYGTTGPATIDISGVLAGKPKKPKMNDPITDGIVNNKKTLEVVRDEAKSVLENENESFKQRLLSLDVFTNTSESIIKLQGEKELRNKKLTEEGKLAIQQDVQNKINKVRQDNVNRSFDINRDIFIKELKDKADQDQRVLNSLNEEEAFKLDLLNESYAKRTVSEKQFGELRIKIQREYAKKYIDEEIKQVQELLNNSNLTVDQRADAEKKLAKFKIESSRLITKNQIEDNDKITDREKVNAEKRKQLEQDLAAKKAELAKAVLDVGVSIVNSGFENQKNKIKEESDLIEKKKNTDIENVNNSIATEEEKANRIAVIEAVAVSKKEEIERRLHDIDVKKAKFQKLVSVAEIGINTAKDIAKVTTGAAALSIIPIIGPALAAAALAQIPFMIGVGAAQIATVLATPIPAFEHGGVMSKNGLAMYGEVGSELMIDPSGKLSLTPDKPTIGHVQAGTQFISNKDLVAMMGKPDPVHVVNGREIDLTPLLNAQDNSSKRIIKAINSQKGHSTIITKGGWRSTQNGMNLTEDYLRRNFN